MTPAETLTLAAYFFVLIILAVYGWHRYYLVYLYMRYRDREPKPGPALLHVKVRPMQLVMPPSPLVSPEAVVGMGVYTARAMLQGKGHDVWEMMVENIP